MINAFYYFPAIVYRVERPDWVEKTLNIFDKEFNTECDENKICQTKNLNNNNNIKFLTDYLIQIGEEILDNQGYDMKKYDLFVDAIWGQEIKNNFFTDIHLHKNSQLCGWFFLETPKSGSYPIYYDTRINKEMIELDHYQTSEIKDSTSSIHFNNVIPGTILLSNSWMKHQLSPNFSKQSTKTVHFIISHKDKLCNI